MKDRKGWVSLSTQCPRCLAAGVRAGRRRGHRWWPGEAGLVDRAPAASAKTSRCLVVDTDADTSYASLQDAVDAAAAGDTLFVKGTCAGTTEISKKLTISGHSAGGTKTGTLVGDAPQFQGGVLVIDSGVSVTLNTMIITNGHAVAGGAIFNEGTLTLNSSTVRGNSPDDIASD